MQTDTQLQYYTLHPDDLIVRITDIIALHEFYLYTPQEIITCVLSHKTNDVYTYLDYYDVASSRRGKLIEFLEEFGLYDIVRSYFNRQLAPMGYIVNDIVNFCWSEDNVLLFIGLPADVT